MSLYYFAYGSNMNSARMQARGLSYQQVLAGYIPNLAPAFNKRANDAPHRAYANVVYARGKRVEGLLYKLNDPQQILKMDPFEGAPYRYSRDVFWVHTQQGAIAAWVYVANKAMLQEGLQPETWYLQHLLAGREYLSDNYFQMLCGVTCCDADSPVTPPDCLGRNT